MDTEKISQEEWLQHQQWEADWWGLSCQNTVHEEVKQLAYAKRMGLAWEWNPAHTTAYTLDLRGKSVIDIGGGPVSLLLKARNGGKLTVVDPCPYPAWVDMRYTAAGIEIRRFKGEDLIENTLVEPADEVWIYNCLQHVEDPALVLRNAKRLGRVIRLIEQLNVGVCPGHPHNLTQEWLEAQLGKGMVEQINEPCIFGTFFFGVFRGDRAEPIRTAPRSGKPMLHMMGLAHLPTAYEYFCCAFTQKIVKMARMMKARGYPITFYGVEGSQVECDEMVTVLSQEDWQRIYGGHDWKVDFFQFNGTDEGYTKFNQAVIPEILAREAPGDLLLLPMGHYNKIVGDSVRSIEIEPYVGYEGVCTSRRVFESYAWMHHVYGMQKQGDGVWLDSVIPNYFEVEKFPFCAEKQDYLMMVTRLIERKGCRLAGDIAKRMGLRLLVCGQGDPSIVGLDQPHVTYLGPLGYEERNALVGKARALLAPTIYIEPFGGVVVEAALCGTPTITSDWGAFSENVLPGVTGFRCRTMAEFLKAVELVSDLKPEDCRRWAESRYSLERVGGMFDHYFQMIRNHGGVLEGADWYTPEPDVDLSWMA
jgi:glycosyltransferase involved in cell wall biosynthesis